jgi:hypothetical protein
MLGLPHLKWFAWDERRLDDHAIDPKALEETLNDVPAGTRFVANA